MRPRGVAFVLRKKKRFVEQQPTRDFQPATPSPHKYNGPHQAHGAQKHRWLCPAQRDRWQSPGQTILGPQVGQNRCTVPRGCRGPQQRWCTSCGNQKTAPVPSGHGSPPGHSQVPEFHRIAHSQGPLRTIGAGNRHAPHGRHSLPIDRDFGLGMHFLFVVSWDKRLVRQNRDARIRKILILCCCVVSFSGLRYEICDCSCGSVPSSCDQQAHTNPFCRIQW